MIRARISNIITIAATALLGLLGLVFAFIEARMLIAGDFAAYAVPWYRALVAVGRLIAALLWMILLPLLGLLLKVRFFRLGAVGAETFLPFGKDLFRAPEQQRFHHQ